MMQSKLKLAYFASRHGNVGDDLNLTLWPHLLGEIFSDDSSTILIGIGSILDNRYKDEVRKIVFGAGARSPTTIPALDASWDIRFVRGPNTAEAMGLGSDKWISDPAILTPLAFPVDATKKAVTRRKIGFIPYFRTDPNYARIISNSAGLEYISITQTPSRFLEQLLSCDRVITEAMHGAIIADSYRIPWKPCRITNETHEKETHLFKWADWTKSLEIFPEFITLPRTWEEMGTSVHGDLKALIKSRFAARILAKEMKNSDWSLSNSNTLTERQDRILSEISSLRNQLSRN